MSKITTQGKEKTVKMEIEVSENWRSFLVDVAERNKTDPAEYWGKEFLGSLKSYMSCERDAVFYGVQNDLLEKYKLYDEVYPK